MVRVYIRMGPQRLFLSACFLSRSCDLVRRSTFVSSTAAAAVAEAGPVPQQPQRRVASVVGFGAPRTHTATTKAWITLRSMASSSSAAATTAAAAAVDEIRLRKRIVRQEIRAKLKSLSREEIQQQSGAVWNRLHELEVYQQAKSIGLFLSMPKGEIDTETALRHAVKTRQDIYVPQVGANFECAEMDLIKVPTAPLSSLNDEHELFHHRWPRNRWGIPEPPSDLPLQAAAPGEIDVLIVPGLAFDRLGNRLGQGKGYYDRFIERMLAANVKAPVLIAVALECQLVELDQIPVHKHDFPVQWVILPNETIRVER